MIRRRSLFTLPAITAILAAPGALAQCPALTTWAASGLIGFTQGTTAPTTWQVLDATTNTAIAKQASFSTTNVSLQKATFYEQSTTTTSPAASAYAAIADALGQIRSDRQAAITTDQGSSGGAAFVGPTTDTPTATAVILQAPAYPIVNYHTYRITVPCSTGALVASVTPPGLPIPPSGLQTNSANPPTISWTPPPAPAVVDRGYTMEYATNAKGPWTGIASGIMATSYTFPADVLGGACFVAVASGNGAGVGALSPRLALSLPPATPKGLQAANAVSQTASTSFGAVDLTWPNAMGATSYVVGQSTSSTGPFTNVKTVTTPSANIQGLTMGGIYYFTVTASGPTGTSKASAPKYWKVGKFLQ